MQREIPALGLQVVPCVFLCDCGAARQGAGWVSARGNRLWIPVSLDVCTMSVCGGDCGELCSPLGHVGHGAGSRSGGCPEVEGRAQGSAQPAGRLRRPPTQRSAGVYVCVFRPSLMYDLAKCSSVGRERGPRTRPPRAGDAVGPGGAEGLRGNVSPAGCACGCGVVWHRGSRLCPPSPPLYNDSLGLDALFVNIYP